MKYILVLIYLGSNPSMVVVSGDFESENSCKISGIYARLQLEIDDARALKFMCVPSK